MMARVETLSRSRFHIRPIREVPFSDAGSEAVVASPTRSASDPPATAGRGWAGRGVGSKRSQGGSQ